MRMLIRKLNFSKTEQIFHGTQNFTSQLTWLHLVYGKILLFPRHPLLMVYVECYSL